MDRPTRGLAAVGPEGVHGAVRAGHDRVQSAATLDVCGAALRFDVGPVWTADLHAHVGAPPEAEPAAAVAHVDDDLVLAGALAQLDAGVRDGFPGRIVVPERLERDDRLPLFSAVEPDLARAEPDLCPDRPRRLKRLGPHRLRLPEGRTGGRCGRRSMRTST